MGYIEMNMKSTQCWNASSKAQEFVNILISEGDFLLPQKYDSREPERYVFEANNLAKLFEIWASDTGWLSLKRQKPFLWWMLIQNWRYREHRQFNQIMSGFDERYFAKEDNVVKLLSCAKRLYVWGNMTYGYICHEQDWSRKNYFGIPTKVASGKTVSTGGLDLREGLPGIYWANLFGPIYVDFFGREKFLTAPAYHKEELPDGGFLLLTAPSPLDYGRPEVQALEEALIDHLGRDAFFEKAYPEKPCQVPHFTFNQAAFGRPIEIVAYDPISEVIPDPYRFVQEAPLLAEALIRRFQGKLDYSPESLKQVDDFILKRSYRRPEPWRRGEEGVRLMQELTAYYGEVLRRHLGGRWVVDDRGEGNKPHPAVIFTVVGVPQMEYPFARVDRLWEERVRADGLAIRFMLLQSGEWARLEEHLKGLGGNR
jgi:hypothetical protein